VSARTRFQPWFARSFDERCADRPTRRPRAHELKCWPTAFEDVTQGRKHYEVRWDDRGFEVGDSLILREWSPYSSSLAVRPFDGFTGREAWFEVVHKTEGGMWGLPEGLCVLGIRRHATALIALPLRPRSAV
jgi:hypothetical protein